RPGPDVRQRVLHFEDPVTGGVQETSEGPAADEENAREGGRGAGQDRKSAHERAPEPLPQTPLRDVYEEEEDKRGSRGAALLGQHGERVTGERRGEGSDAHGSALEDGESEAQVQEREH